MAEYDVNLNTGLGPLGEKIATVSEPDGADGWRTPVKNVNGDNDEIFTSDNPGEFRLNSRQADTADTTIQDGVTDVCNGTAYELNGKDKVIMSISGTALEREVAFKAVGPGGVVGNILGSKIEDDGSITLAASTDSADDEIWVFEGLAGYASIYAQVVAVSDGDVTVNVRGVA